MIGNHYRNKNTGYIITSQSEDQELGLSHDPKFERVTKSQEESERPERPPYYDIFNKTFKEDLGQPSDIDPKRVSDTVNGWKTLFINEYTKQTKQAPTSEQVDDFISSTLTKDNIKKTIIGGFEGLQVVNQVIKPYIQVNPDILPKEPEPAPEPDPLEGLAEKVANLYDVGQKSTISEFIQQLRDQTIPQRQNIVSEEAALGRLSSPVGTYRLNQLDTNVGREQARGLSNIIGNFASQRIGNELDISKTIANIRENMILAQNAAKQRASEFSQDIGLRKQSLAAQIAQYENENEINRRAIAAGQYAAQQRAEAERPGVADYAKTAALTAAQFLPYVGPAITAGKTTYGLFKKKPKQNKPIIV